MSLAKFIDGVVEAVSPTWAAERVAARRAVERARSFAGGGIDRGNARWLPSAESGDSPRVDEIQRCRQRAWDLYRNNPHAAKLVRTIVSQVVGTGLKPESLAVNEDGTPHNAFRERAKELYRRWDRQADVKGRPGAGGVTFGEMTAQALRESILTGECLARRRFMRLDDSRNAGLVIPLRLEMIEAERVPEDGGPFTPGTDIPGHQVFRGIEYDADSNRAAYHVMRTHPNDPRTAGYGDTVPVPADEMVHLYVQERPSQSRGWSWFARALLDLRDVADYQYNELMSSALAACVTLSIKRTAASQGVGALPSLAPPVGSANSDADGNAMTRMQPGMIFHDVDVQGFNPQRPNSTAEGFINHLLRGVATGLPGVKASSVTGDYRESSFSSERSADNDCWRETEMVQDWLAAHFCQPVWESVVEAGVRAGFFVDVVDQEEFLADTQRFVGANWHGPVARSINPADDEQASALAIRNCTSSPQAEAAARGYDWAEIIKQNAEFYAAAANAGLPPEYALGVLGIKLQPAAVESPVATRRVVGLNGQDMSRRGA